MTTKLPAGLHEQIEREVTELVDLKSYDVDTAVGVRLDGEQVAMLMLATRSGSKCKNFFTKFAEKEGMGELNAGQRQTFAVGMLAAARMDVVDFLLDKTAMGEDIRTCDIVEAAALQVVILIMGNLVLTTLEFQRAQAGGLH